MKQRVLNERVVSDPAVLLGKPIIRGARVPVYIIVGLVESGQMPEQVIDDYPDLTFEDIEAALACAAQETARTDVRALQGAVVRLFSMPTSPPGSGDA